MARLGQPAGGTCRGGAWNKNADIDAALACELGNNLPQVIKSAIKDPAKSPNPTLGHVAPTSKVALTALQYLG